MEFLTHEIKSGEMDEVCAHELATIAPTLALYDPKIERK